MNNLLFEKKIFKFSNTNEEEIGNTADTASRDTFIETNAYVNTVVVCASD